MQLSSLEKSQHNSQVLRGFLNVISLVKPELSERILNEAVTDSVLASLYPILQTSVGINAQSVERLKKSLEHGVAPIQQYEILAYGKVYESISDEDLSDLLRLIAPMPDGLSVAIDILHTRLHGYSHEKQPLSDAIISSGQELLLKMPISRKDGHMDYKLVKVIEVCFANDSAKDNAKALCINFAKAFANHEICYSMSYGRVLETQKRHLKLF